MANCLECDATLFIDEGEVEEGEIVHCEDCGFEMEVVNTSPLQLAPVGGSEGWSEGESGDGSEVDE
jgi:alpha-aminoadipate carrier protein LysW